MKPSVSTTKVVTSVEREIKYFTLANNVVVYQITTIVSKDGVPRKPTTVEGCTSTVGLAIYLEASGEVSMSHYSDEQGVILATPEFLKRMTTHVWGYDMANVLKMVAKPYTRYKQGTATANDVVYCSYKGMTDVEGLPLPTAVVFDYVKGSITSNKYDLDKVIATLKSRSDTSCYTDLLYCPQDTDEDPPKYVAFTWTPSVSDYRAAMALCTDFYNKSIQEAALELDIFGFIKGGCQVQVTA